MCPVLMSGTTTYLLSSQAKNLQLILGPSLSLQPHIHPLTRARILLEPALFATQALLQHPAGFPQRPETGLPPLTLQLHISFCTSSQSDDFLKHLHDPVPHCLKLLYCSSVRINPNSLGQGKL